MEKLIALISLAFTLFSSGCQSQQSTKPEAVPPKQVESDQQAEPQVDKLLINEDIKNPDILAWRELYKSQRGAFTQTFGQQKALLIGLGQQPTGGYSVRLAATKTEADQIIIEYATQRPKPQETVTQAVTYPHLLLALNTDKPLKVFELVDKERVPVQVVEVPKNNVALSTSFIITAPTSNQAVKNTVHIEGYASVFEGAFSVTVEDGHNILAEKNVQTEGAPNWGHFAFDLPVEGATNPAGSVIFSYSSPKDGTIINEIVIPIKFEEIGEI